MHYRAVHRRNPAPRELERRTSADCYHIPLCVGRAETHIRIRAADARLAVTFRSVRVIYYCLRLLAVGNVQCFITVLAQRDLVLGIVSETERSKCGVFIGAYLVRCSVVYNHRASASAR